MFLSDDAIIKLSLILSLVECPQYKKQSDIVLSITY
jgi:hypothetical protein